jgi:hypothetical protein
MHMKAYKQTLPSQRFTKPGQREDLHGSGVYPSSGPWPKGNAQLRAPADWAQRHIGPSQTTQKVSETNPVAEKAERARKAVQRKIRADVDEAYSQGQTVERTGPIGKQIRTG